MEKYILAIDQSTTGTKAILFDHKLNLVKRATEHHTQYYPRPGWIEHDPKEILKKTFLACKNLLKDINPQNIAAVSVANQRETTVMWNKDGEPIYNAIVWQCQRGKNICEKLKEKGYEKTIKQKTGLLIDPYFSASKVAWILENVEKLKYRIQSENIFFGTIDSWLIYNLCENHPHLTDYSNASRTMLFNIHSLEWDKEILDLFKIPIKIMPGLLPSDEIFGYTDLNGILPKKIPIIGVMGDSSAALYGQMGHNYGDSKATYGTGTSIMINLQNKKPILNSGVLSIGWVVNGKTTYVAEGNIHSSGDTLKWITEQLELAKMDEIEELAISVDSNNGVYFVPAFNGLGAPYWKNKARAIICGISRGTTKAHLVRAAVESIAFQVNDLFSSLVEETKLQPSNLKVDGGATKNRFLMQFQADILNLPVYVNNVEECSARGVALIAANKIGLVQFDEIPINYTKYLPNMPSDIRDKYLKEWHIAVRRTISC
ncbi:MULTISPECIES: FGGY-family carbohydrate kinase [Pseudothermotoga]|uniref:ATP:glycerol 3-phosphotransferase n=4 Tax=Pseudothermotoga TaxID=1643951 RepID=A8F6V4_PSELT|nr:MULTISPECIES: glycerol kinase [Pseudothermotoga]ABV33888.1 carbohydrate kinase FGGY [Pseudothermotoga lettingae TMO]MDI3494154.1 glycerol kinase [Pseudothermotoga sp.]MDK2884281.1 glycerol kinase [Pseudothermotoga sp.]GLI49175.1 glycerol kinase 1 [Pseudothermotoga lettingae TMO]